MRKPILAGIDVSSEDFAVAWENPGKSFREARFANTTSGHRKLCSLLTRNGRSARVCLEATGIYHLDLALALHRTPGIQVMVANPRAPKDFHRARMRRTKTDATDAAVLVEFLKSMPFRAWKPPTADIFALRAISRRITALTVLGAQERNRRHLHRCCQELPDILEDEIQAHKEFLQDSIERLTQRALEILQKNPKMRKAFQHLVSVKGIATATAIGILSELAVLPGDMTVRQWVAHAGLDPRHYESGSSVKKPTRISKTGNRYIRAALYMPALVAIRCEPNVGAFYNQLLKRGKKPIQAIVAVMRKLLHAIYGMLTHDCDFEGEKFFAMAS